MELGILGMLFVTCSMRAICFFPFALRGQVNVLRIACHPKHLCTIFLLKCLLFVERFAVQQLIYRKEQKGRKIVAKR